MAVGPVGVRSTLGEIGIGHDHPSTFPAAHHGLHARTGVPSRPVRSHGFIVGDVLEVLGFARGPQKGGGGQGQVRVDLVGSRAVVGGAGDHDGVRLGPGVHVLCRHEGGVGPFGIVQAPAFGEDGQRGRDVPQYVRAQLGAQDSLAGAATTGFAHGVLGFGPAPPAVVLAKVAHSRDHAGITRPSGPGAIAVEFPGIEEKLRPELRLVEDVGDAVGPGGEAVVVGVFVFVVAGHGGGQGGQGHQGVAHGLRLLQMVAAVVPASLIGTGLGGPGQLAIGQVARSVEPRRTIAAAIDSVELEHVVAHIAVEAIGHQENSGCVLAHHHTVGVALQQADWQGAFLDRALGDAGTHLVRAQHVGGVPTRHQPCPTRSAHRDLGSAVEALRGQDPATSRGFACGIDHREGRGRPHVVELGHVRLDIHGAVAGLVHPDSPDLQGQGVAEALRRT